jgi:hypothetical protein
MVSLFLVSKHMLKAVSDNNAPLTINAVVRGLPIYLDNHSLIRLAKGDPSRRSRFVKALHQGADLLFSLANAFELAGPQGDQRTTLRSFLDEIGPYWVPVELDARVVVDRELAGAVGGAAFVANDFLTQLSAFWMKDHVGGSGKVVGLDDSFFRLGTVMEWLEPHRDQIKTSRAKLDSALVAKIRELRTEYERDAMALDRAFPIFPFRDDKPATFVYANLVRQLVIDFKGFHLKRGDGMDFFHAVIGCAYGSIATLDKHWKRRIEKLTQPNKLARVYYEPALDSLVADIEGFVKQLNDRNCRVVR